MFKLIFASSNSLLDCITYVKTRNSTSMKTKTLSLSRKTWGKLSNEMDLDHVLLLRQNKPVGLNTATPGELVKIHLIAQTYPTSVTEA